MELVAISKSGEELGIIEPISADFAFGASENSFEIEVPNRDYMEPGTLVVAYGTEVGGRIVGVDDTSSLSALKLVGKTWHGILEQSIICPPSGSEYRTVTGDARSVLRSLVSAIGMADYFGVKTGNSGISISGYKMVNEDYADDDQGRYAPAYSSIVRMLLEHGAKLTMEYSVEFDKVILNAEAQYDWSQDDEWDSDYCSVGIRTEPFVNHLIILGQGEGATRDRTDMYINKFGKVVSTPTLIGMDKWMDVYDFNNAKDAAQIAANGKKRLRQGFMDATKVDVDFKAEDDTFHVGDIVGAIDSRTGISASATICKKIYKYTQNDGWRVSYETGDF